MQGQHYLHKVAPMRRRRGGNPQHYRAAQEGPTGSSRLRLLSLSVVALRLGLGMCALLGALCLPARTSAETATLMATADTFVRRGAPNANEGGSPLLWIWAVGQNRILVRFDQDELSTLLGDGVLRSAILQFDIVETPRLWRPHGRTVDVHRLLMDWTEGNGRQLGLSAREHTRGEGVGATWKCASDMNIANSRPDCPTTAWEMGTTHKPVSPPYAAMPTASALMTNGQSGTVEWDVTADVAAFLAGTSNFGWLLKKTQERQSGRLTLAARESGLGPRLLLTYDRAPQTVSVPDVTGLPEPEARTLLESAGLTVGVRSERLSLVVPSGAVIRQTPKAGTEVASGAAVDMQVSAPVPAGDVTMPEGWAGRWAMTIAVRSLATNSVTAEEVFTDSLCPGDPLGLVLLDQLQDCTGMVSDTQLEVSCQAQLSVGLCTIDATVQVQVERTSDMMNGSGQWTTTATGMCGSIPVSQGEALEITGQRVSADPGGCEPPAAVLQKFGRHPALIVLDAQQ